MRCAICCVEARKIAKGMCEILQDCEKICDVFWNIGEDRKKNMERTRRSKHQEMAGDSRENYDGRFAGILWREVCWKNIE